LDYKVSEYVKMLDINSAKEEVERMLSQKIEPKEIRNQIFLGLTEVGRKYERGEYFIGDLIVSGMLVKEVLALEEMKDSSSANSPQNKGRILIGTVCDDIHDIGKDIMTELLASGGIEVINLGVDVPPQKFVEGIRKYNPDILGLSCTMTTSINYIFKTIDVIKDAGLRDNLKIIIGGTAISKKYSNINLADEIVNDAYKGLKICQEWVGKNS